MGSRKICATELAGVAPTTPVPSSPRVVQLPLSVASSVCDTLSMSPPSAGSLPSPLPKKTLLTRVIVSGLPPPDWLSRLTPHRPPEEPEAVPLPTMRLLTRYTSSWREMRRPFRSLAKKVLLTMYLGVPEADPPSTHRPLRPLWWTALFTTQVLALWRPIEMPPLFDPLPLSWMSLEVRMMSSFPLLPPRRSTASRVAPVSSKPETVTNRDLLMVKAWRLALPLSPAGVTRTDPTGDWGSRMMSMRCDSTVAWSLVLERETDSL